MNDIFNLNRFGLLFKKTIAERPAQLGGLMALVLAVTFGAFALGVYLDRWNMAHNGCFIWGFIGGGIVMASVVFNYFGTNASGAGYLTLPASAFEKWLCGVLIAGVLFTAIFLGFFRLIDTLFVNTYHNPGVAHLMDSGKPEIFPFDGRLPRQAYGIFLNFAGAMMLGSLYFNKAGFIKTALALFVIIVAIFILNNLTARLFYNNLDGAMPFSDITLKLNTPNSNSYQLQMFRLPPDAANAFTFLWNYVLPAVLWITAFIRLKEKEI